MPSYSWLLDSLKPFDVVEDLRHGKGSHGSLVRTGDGGTFRQGTWRGLRDGHSPIRLSFLWEVLANLRISPEQYYRSLVSHG